MSDFFTFITCTYFWLCVNVADMNQNSISHVYLLTTRLGTLKGILAEADVSKLCQRFTACKWKQAVADFG